MSTEVCVGNLPTSATEAALALKFIKFGIVLSVRLEGDANSAKAPRRAFVEMQTPSQAALREHAVIVGFGPVGSRIAQMLQEAATPFVVIERDRGLVTKAREHGAIVVHGDASSATILEAASLSHARVIVISTSDGWRARRILEAVRELHPSVKTAVRSDGDAERGPLDRMDANLVVTSEPQVALALGTFAIDCFAAPPAD